MIRLSKFADYGIVLLSFVARATPEQPINARQLSKDSGLPLPTVSKILKTVARAGILVSHRGKQGGYTLGRPATQISVADIIAAIDGPIALTDCGGAATVEPCCELEGTCPVRSNWQRITLAVQGALGTLSLAELTPPTHPVVASTLLQLPRAGRAGVADGGRRSAP